ncbi:MAG: hypothetical protein IKN17_05150 [Ruminococcus sp.]|nr:hypothetical protein [Ruminococcus sp.]
MNEMKIPLDLSKNKSKDSFVSYTKQLVPPDGYELSLAVGATYSLHIDALERLMVSLLGIKDSPEDGNERANIDTFIPALERLREKVILFHDNARLKLVETPDKEIPDIIKLWDTMTVGIGLPYKDGSRCSFHPKVWVVRYQKKNNGNEFIYRVLVLSRNVSFDPCLDTVFSMEGTLTEDSQEKNKNRPLCDFLRELADHADGEKKKDIKELAEQLKTVCFKRDDGLGEDFEFLPTGIKGPLITESGLYTTKFDEALIISPFLSDDILRHFADKAKDKAKKLVLMTRKDQLALIPEEYRKRIGVYILGEDAEKNFNIHAKIYLTKTGSNYDLYVGSLNLTHSAFNNNIEFALRLGIGAKYYEDLKDMLQSKETKLFVEAGSEDYEKSASEAEDPEKQAKKAVDDVFTFLSRIGITASVSEDSSGEYRITVNAGTDDLACLNDKLAKIPGGAEIKLRPLSERKKFKTLREEVQFDELEFKDISQYYSVKIADEIKLMPIPTKVPDDVIDQRDEALIENYKHGYLSYLYNRKVKGGSSSEGEGFGTVTDASSYPSLPIEDGLYEHMLYAAFKGTLDEYLPLISDEKQGKLFSLIEEAAKEAAEKKNIPGGEPKDE